MIIFSQNEKEINLDNGVKINDFTFKEILYPIAGLC